ncbi:MAG: sulfide dehydrogenase cytochrome subunit [Candidatus Azotimanducaceae bacterium]|jgi:sulfide dehydrogenase cytochrome subunit
MKTIAPWLLLLFVGASAADEIAARASAMAATCSGCHGGTSQVLPTLKNIKASVMAQQLLAFKSGERSATLMNRIARGYTDDELISIADILGKP